MSPAAWTSESHWRDRSGWTLTWEIKRWAKCLLASVPGGLGSHLRCRLYGIGSVGKDVKLSEGFWVEYPGNLRLADHIGINRDCFMNAAGGLDIEDWVLIGPRVVIYTQNHDVSVVGSPLAMAGDVRKPVRIRRGAWIAAGAIILPGVTVGAEAVVAAGAVVAKDVPERTVVAGVPATTVRVRTVDPADLAEQV